MWLKQSLQSSVKMQKGVLAISETWKLPYQGWALQNEFLCIYIF